MSESEPIYCPLCREQLCTSDDPVKPNLFFGCERCCIVFCIVIRDSDLSEALRMVAEITRTQ